MFPWLPSPHSRALEAVRDVSLAKVVREHILGRILAGELAPGMRINEPDVAERLGVSRVPVREALRELESSGLVAARKNMGVFVREIEDAEVADLYSFRALLDGGAGRRAATLPASRRKLLVRALESAEAAMRKAARDADVPAYYRENLRFHWAIVEAAGSVKLCDAYIGVVQQLHVWRLRNLAQPAGMPASIQEHEAVVRAIRAGDAERTESLLAAHVAAAHQRLDAHLKEDSPK